MEKFRNSLKILLNVTKKRTIPPGKKITQKNAQCYGYYDTRQ